MLVILRIVFSLIAEPNGGDKTPHSDDEDQPEYYNKTKSFFDSISCEATDRAEG